MAYTLHHALIKTNMILEVPEYPGKLFYVCNVELGNDDCTTIYGNTEGFFAPSSIREKCVLYFYGFDRLKVIGER